MRIAFVAGNRERLPDPVIPLGVLSVLAACPPEHERIFVDLCFEADPHAALAVTLADFRPDLVAIGIRNLQDNAYGPLDAAIDYYRSLVAVVRAHAPEARVVLGGGGFSILPEALLVEIGADVGIAGEGEVAFAALVEALSRGTALARVPGIVRLDRGRAVRSPRPAGLASLDTLPLVDRRLVDRRHYELCGTDSVQTKRGCPMLCSYCSYPQIEGRTHRLRDPERVVDELALALEAGARHVFVVDAVFNLPARHARAVCDAIVRRGLSTPWTAYVNPVCFDPPLAEAMRRAGAVGMEVGSDSGDDAVLTRLSKGFDVKAIRRLRAVARGAGLKDCHTFILGTPGETLDSVRRTLDLVVDMDPPAAILMLWNDERESLDRALAEGRRALREAILELLDRERGRHPRWVIPQLGVNFRPRMFALLRRRGLTGPLWQHLDRVDGTA